MRSPCWINDTPACRPFPIFDEDEDRWHVLWVGYACDLSWVVRAGLGNIFGAVSSVAGVAGVAGPYLPYGVVIGPNATVNGTTWGDLSKCELAALISGPAERAKAAARRGSCL